METNVFGNVARLFGVAAHLDARRLIRGEEPHCTQSCAAAHHFAALRLEKHASATAKLRTAEALFGVALLRRAQKQEAA